MQHSLSKNISVWRKTYKRFMLHWRIHSAHVVHRHRAHMCLRKTEKAIRQTQRRCSFFFFITFYTYICVFTRRSKLLKHIESQSRFSHWWLSAFVCDASSTTLYRIFVLYIRLQFTLLTYFQIVTIFIHIQCEVSVTVLHIQFCIRAPLRHRCTWCITSYLIDATT